MIEAKAQPQVPVAPPAAPAAPQIIRPSDQQNAANRRIEEIFADGALEDALDRMLNLHRFFDAQQEDLFNLKSQLAMVSGEFTLRGTIPFSEEMLSQNRIRRGFQKCLVATKREIVANLMDLPVLTQKITSQAELLQIVLTEKLGDRYGQIRFIQHGNTGIFFQASDNNTGQAVVIKVLKIMDVGTDLPQQEQLQRFLRLKHRNIIRILDFNIDRLPAYVTSEYIHGTMLTEAIQATQGLPLESALRIARHLADGLEYLRKHGIRHANIRPSKIYLDMDEEPLLSAADILRRDTDELRTLSRFKEECRYLSPEALDLDPTQLGFKGKDAVERSDQFSVGLILLEMLIAQPLFLGKKDKTGGETPGQPVVCTVEGIFRDREEFFKNPDKILRKVLQNCWNDDPVAGEDPAENQGPTLFSVLKTMLAFNPDDRYPDLDATVADLKAIAPKTEAACPAKASFHAARKANFYLIPDFYQLFFQKMGGEVAGSFPNLERQYLMLKLAINVLLEIEKPEKAKAFGTMLASDKHKRFQVPSEYVTFLNLFRDTVLENYQASDAKKQEARARWDLKIGLAERIIRDVLPKNSKTMEYRENVAG